MDFGSSQFLIQTHQVTLPARGRKPSDRERWASTSKATRANPLGCLFQRSGPGMIFTFLRSRFLSLPSRRQNPNVTSIMTFVLAPVTQFYDDREHHRDQNPVEITVDVARLHSAEFVSRPKSQIGDGVNDAVDNVIIKKAVEP